MPDTSKTSQSGAPNRGQFLVGAAATAAFTLGHAPYIMAQTKEIVIGLNVPLSGPYSDQGQDQLKAYNLAIEQINAAGGIMKMKVRAVQGDDQTKAPVAKDNAGRMIERDGAIMITGGSSTGTAVAVSGVCQEKKTIFMATLTHGDETTDESCHRHTFRRYNNAHMSARSMAKTLLTKYGTGKWFHITADYTWGHSVYENLIEVLEPKGAKTVQNILVPLGTTDFSSQLGQARAAKPDVLVITEFGRDMVNAVNQAAQFGLTKSTKLLVPLADEYMAKGVGDNFDGVVTTAPFFWKYHMEKYPKAKTFVQAFQKKYGTPPSNGAECAYTDIMLYKDAVERAGTTNPEKVIEKLSGSKFQATKEAGEYFREWDHQGINSCLVLEGKANRGADGFDYANVLEVHDGESVSIPKAGSKCKIESA